MKQSPLDIIPPWLVKQFLAELAVIISLIWQMPLSPVDFFPAAMKSAIVTPLGPT